MRKSIVAAVVLILCVSVLAGCGGGGSDTPTSQTPTTQSPPSTTPEQTTTPTTTTPAETPTTPTTPEAIPMTTYTWGNDRFGSFSLSYPEGMNVDITETENSQDSKFLTDVAGAASTRMGRQYVHMVFDEFGFVLGAEDFGRQFEGYMESRREEGRANSRFREIEFGNGTGFSTQSDGVYYLYFPTPAAEHARVIAIYTADTIEQEDDTDIDVLEIPEILAILETLVLDGDAPGGDTTGDSGTTTSTPTRETIEGGYITFTAEDGWHVVDTSGLENEKTYRIQYQDSVFTQIRIRLDKFNTLLELTDGVVSSVSAERLDDISIGGNMYHVLQQSGGQLWLTTSAGAFDDDKTGAIEISLGTTTLETAMPFLVTISLHELN